MSSQFDGVILLIGRVFLGASFVRSGYHKLLNPGGFAAAPYLKGLPLPVVFAIAIGLVELLVSLAVIVGFRTRSAALVMTIFTLVAALWGHSNWYDGYLIDNLAVTGGFLILLVRGAGPLSIDRR